MGKGVLRRAIELAEYRLVTRERPLGLALARSDGACDDALLPQRVLGSESMCGGFVYRVLCVADDAGLALKDFIGVPAELRIVTDRGQLRRICGIVTEALSGQSDGALATYQLVIRDALSVMEGRSNTRVFRNRSELDVVRALVSEWHARSGVLRATFDLEIAAGLENKHPQRELIMQHNESDAAFIRRLLWRRGIASIFRSGLPGREVRPGQEPAIGHTMVLFDDSNQLARNLAGTVRFHRDAATEERDAIDGWGAARSLRPGSASLYSWDYKQPAGSAFMAAHTRSRIDQGEQGNDLAAVLDDYRVTPPHLGDTARDLADLGDVRIGFHDYESKHFYGEGGVRDLSVGEWFSLKGHPEVDTHPTNERDFVVTSQHIAARNNLPVEIDARIDRLLNGNGWDAADCAVFAEAKGKPICFRTRFTCVRRGIRIVPPPAPLPVVALQTAIVVGPANEEVWCDELGRVKIRFQSARPEDHAHAGGAGSSDSDRDSAWVRVATSWAGSALGTHGECGTRLLAGKGCPTISAVRGGRGRMTVPGGGRKPSCAGLSPSWLRDSASACSPRSSAWIHARKRPAPCSSACRRTISRCVSKARTITRTSSRADVTTVRRCRSQDGRSDPATRRKNSAMASVPSTASRSPTPVRPTCGAARSMPTKCRPAPPMRC